MLKIFNKPALTRQQRFTKALIVGGSLAAVLMILKIIIAKVFFVEFSLLYVGIGYLIGYSIQKYGRGVQIQFSVLAAVLTAILIIICDLVTYGGLTNTIHTLGEYGMNSLFEVCYRIAAIVLSFKFARIL